MFNCPAMCKRSRADNEIVKLFDSCGLFSLVEEPDRTVKTAVPDDSNDIQCCADIHQRVAVDNDEIGACAGGDATEAQAQAQRGGGVDASRPEYLGSGKSGVRESQEFGV